MIRGITREFANLAWTELAATICELLQWRHPNGGFKSRECCLFPRELHCRGWLPWLTAQQLRPSPHIGPPRYCQETKNAELNFWSCHFIIVDLSSASFMKFRPVVPEDVWS
jgi:hypothetical protein